MAQQEYLCVKYPKINKNVIGINFDLVNKDRAQVGSKQLPNKTVYADSKTGELK